jgi:hypothetical protein
MAGLLVRWWWVGLACGIGACRAHESLCTGVACDAAWAEGGAPSAPADEEGGHAGAAAPACLSDEQCQNDSLCDGKERCAATGCEPGPVLTCEYGTACDDEAAELCVYEQPSPWLLATSLGALVGLPAARLGDEPLIALAPPPGETALEGFANIFWSPDGEVAILRADEVEFGQSFHYLRFGAGLPSAVSLLPDVPNYTSGETEPEFSPDSEYVFIRDYASGTYLLNLVNPSVPTRFIAPIDGAFVNTTFCAGSRSWLAWKSVESALDPAWIATLEGDEISDRSIGEIDGFEISRDRRLLATSKGLDDQGYALGVVLRPCSNAAWSVEFPKVGYLAFSPDSKMLWLDGEAGQTVFSLEDPRSPRELLSSVDLGAELSATFTPDSKYLLGRVDGIQHLIDPRQGSSQVPIPLGLAETSEIAALRSAALLAWRNDESMPDQLVWQAVPPSAAPVPILENVTPSNATLVDDQLNPNRVFLLRENADESELFSFLLDGSAPEAKLLLTVEGSFVAVTAAPDESGIVFALDNSAPGGTLKFAPFKRSGELDTPLPVSKTALLHKFQPWP